jgi:hypothetical protein
VKPEAQRIAIAEVCGWKGPDHKEVQNHVATWQKPEIWWMNPKGELTWISEVPDYLNDLNAMHDAEKMLTAQQGGDYDSHLWIIIQRDKTRPACWHATAAQRAEAFLKTLNLWKP